MKEIGMVSVLGVPSRVLALLLGIGIAVAGLRSVASAAPPAETQQSFASPDAAVAALVGALQAGDVIAASKVLGPGAENMVVSGDPVADRASRQRFLDAYAASHLLMPADNGRIVLTVGLDAWPLPIPPEQVDGQWRFDAEVGAQEIIDRRIGRNELLTIRTLLAVVAAQKDYFDRLQRGTGTGAYAQHLGQAGRSLLGRRGRRGAEPARPAGRTGGERGLSRRHRSSRQTDAVSRLSLSPAEGAGPGSPRWGRELRA